MSSVLASVVFSIAFGQSENSYFNPSDYDLKLMEEHIQKAKMNYEPARLVTGSKWYIVWYVFNIQTQKKQRIRDYSINKFKSSSDRKAYAKELIVGLNSVLANGYVIGTLQDVILHPSTPKTIDLGNKFDLQHLTVKEAIEFAIKRKGTQNRASTQKDYRTFRNTFVEWLKENSLEELLLKDLNSRILFDFFDYLDEEREIQAKTYNNYVTNFHSLLEVFVTREIITKNPMKCIEKKAYSSNGHTPFTNDQLKAILDEFNSSGDKQMILFINFLYYTLGRPKTEVAKLKIGDIKIDGIRFDKGNAKNKRTAYIQIPEALEKMILEYNLRSYPAHFYVFGANGHPSEKPTSRDHFYNKQSKVLKKLGLTYDKYDLYCYKHTAVCNLIEANVDLVHIMEQCRHSNIQQTAIYAKNLGKVAKTPLAKKYPSLPN